MQSLVTLEGREGNLLVLLEGMEGKSLLILEGREAGRTIVNSDAPAPGKYTRSQCTPVNRPVWTARSHLNGNGRKQ